LVLKYLGNVQPKKPNKESESNISITSEFIIPPHQAVVWNSFFISVWNRRGFCHIWESGYVFSSPRGCVILWWTWQV